tara:strand:- start:20510 stop:22564 length:2055 start_codon:yes stop_codon:yes gene_type:complete
MAYTVNHTDVANKGSIIVEDNTINTQTSLQLPGRNTTAYGTAIAENFLHLLENFAFNTAPSNPVEGQLWYDTTPGVDQLKIYDGTNWVSASGLKKATTQPDANQSVVGDLWVDTDNQQLYLYTGSGWILVGPTFSDGLSTGAKPATIIGTDNVTYTVLIIEVQAKTVGIISTRAFTPKTTLEGFTTIKAGYNLSTSDITGAGVGKYYGTAEKAEALVVGAESVPAANFVRSDKDTPSTVPLKINANGGVTVGQDSKMNFGIEGQAGIITHQTAGSNIDIRVNNEGSTKTVIRVDSNERVGINNLSPAQPLDVTGNIQTSGAVLVNGTTDAVSISTGSIIARGGVGIAKKLWVGSDANLAGLTTTGNIVPNVTVTRNLGTQNEQWLNVFSQNFIGNLTGNVTGSISGRSGSTDKLASSTTFRMTGDVSAPEFTFNGQDEAVKTFVTTISNTFLADKTEKGNSQTTDEFIFNRVTPDVDNDTGVFKISRTNLFKAIPTLPIGMITPFGGLISETPQDWLLCDGSEVLIAEYQNLFNVIKYNFKDQTLVQAGRFALPDLRGRMTMGLDNMGGESANRVTSSAADTLGNVNGSQDVNISLTNLPEHEHDLRGPSGDQYYTLRDITGTPNDPQGLVYDAPTGTQAGQAYPTSGGILTNQAVGQPMNVMNPYMAINYIIYAGDNTGTGVA